MAEVGAKTETAAQDWFVDLIARAGLAARLEDMARREPGCARGLNKAAAKYRGDCVALLQRIETGTPDR